MLARFREEVSRRWQHVGRRALGLLCLLGVVVIWVVSGELIAFIFIDEHFRSPFALTYFNTALFSLYLIGFFFRSSWWAPRAPPKVMFWFHSSCCSCCGGATHNYQQYYQQQQQQQQLVDPTTSTLSSSSLNSSHDFDESLPKHVSEDDDEGLDVNNGENAASSNSLSASSSSNSSVSASSSPPPEPFSVSKVAWIALGFCPLWFAANYFFNLALSMTTVSSATILSSTSSLFTFCFGFLLKVEKASLWKLIGILLTLSGVIIVSLTDTSSSSSAGGSALNGTVHGPSSVPQENVFGDLFALLGAVGYACYAVYLKAKIDDERAVHMPMFFGFVGAINIVLLFPVGVILHVTGIERFSFPSSGNIVGFLIVNGLIGTVVSDYLWVLAVLLVSPVVATVGLSLTIPLSMIADSIVHHLEFKVLYIVGAVLALAGFLFVNTNGLSDVVALFKKLQCKCCRNERTE